MSHPVSPGVQEGRRLRIAVLNRVFAPTGGGAERYSIALVEQLAQRHEIHVFAQTISHAMPGVHYHRVSAPFKKPRWVNQLWYAAATWWATREGFDVVHSHENTWHGQIQTVHVLPVRHNLFHQRRGWRAVQRVLQVFTSPRLWVYLGLEYVRYLPQRGRAVVVTSASLRTTMAGCYPATVPMLQVLTPGVMAVPGPASANAKRQARAQLGLPLDGRCLLLVGNDYRKKGLASLLQAMSTLPTDVVLAVVGNPAQSSEFRTRAAAAGLAHRVFFLGALDRVDPAYQAVDVLVHPTLEDTFAMVVLEAMAYGLPVVVSAERYCGIAGLLRHGVNALLLQDPQDAAALGRELGRLLDDAALRDGLAQQAVAFAEQHLWPALAGQQEQMYFTAAGAT
jgi:glycosyltransferase involved in cell wall biosynthesis